MERYFQLWKTSNNKTQPLKQNIMEQDPLFNDPKIRAAISTLVSIFEQGAFNFSEISATLSMSWALILCNLQKQMPQIISQEPQIIQNFIKRIQYDIASVREAEAEAECD